MIFTYRKFFSGIVTSLLVTMLFSCEGNLKEVRELGLPEDAPQAIGRGVNLKYTDSGKIVATLRSDLMLDFSNKEFPYREFPEGLKVRIYDENNTKSTITADYGIVFDQTGLIDLQGNVVIITGDRTKLTAHQLYWDQNLQWVFTDKTNTIKFRNGTVNKGEGFDSNQEFSKFRSRSNVGVQVIEEQQK